ncbi:MAG: M20/M25/M40 family metallo-hydrolase [Candidatus Micrarchaeota archaeon]|nr:M20/M25/M40 family metallo-hydrolase [Candidatus Micrarchaeota archaeon]
MDIDFLAMLVEIDTNQDAINYRKCAKAISKKAESSGLAVEVHSPNNLKPNIIISLDAGAEQTMLLATHYDVVPAGGGWKHPPFRLTVNGGRAYGRGAADDKGGILAALSALEALRESGSSRVNVRLLVTCDEEIGGEDGLGFVMKKKANGGFLVKGDAAILVDAGPRVYRGSSGRVGGRITARGSLLELLSLLSRMIDYSKQRERVISKLVSASTGRRIWGRFSLTMLDLRAGAVEHAKAGVKSNIIPGECRIKLKGKRETVVLGKQGHAGYPHLAKNAIEKSIPLLRKAAEISDEEGKCEFVFDLRTVPEESLSSAIADFRKYAKEVDSSAELQIEEKSGGYVLSETHPFARMLKSATGEERAYGTLGGTDVQFFSRRGIPSLCFGPIADDSNVHGKDEFVKIRDLEFVSSALVRLCENWRNFRASPYGRVRQAPFFE